MAEWLSLESQAEVERMAKRRASQSSDEAEKSGETILDLVIADHRPGLGGYKLLTFKRRNQSLPMPWHRLRVGTPVLVSTYRSEDSQNVTGIVSRKSKDSIQVACSKTLDADCFRIDLTADEVTRRRQPQPGTAP